MTRNKYRRTKYRRTKKEASTLALLGANLFESNPAEPQNLEKYIICLCLEIGNIEATMFNTILS